MHVRSALAAKMAASVMALAFSGCISIDSEKFAVPVAARQLRDIPPPTAATFEAIAQSDRPPATPERTNIRGQGDGSTSDGAQNPNRIVVNATVKEIEHRAPDFSPEQVASMICRSQGGGHLDYIASGVRAWEATVAARDARTAYGAKRIILKDFNKAEKARQDAMIAYRGNGWFESLLGGRMKKKDLPKPESGTLILENIDLFTFTENGAPVMAISGVIRNRAATPAEVPPITLQAIDAWTWLLAGQTSLLPFETLGPQESKPFEIRFLNPPETTAEVYAHFAPPFEYRGRRNCGNDFDPRLAAPITPETDKAPRTGPVHTASELNELARFYRDEAQRAWICRNGPDGIKDRGAGMRLEINGSGERREGGSLSIGTPDVARMCASWDQRVRWRDMFVLGEATEEAWGAAEAHEEAVGDIATGRGSQALVDAAAQMQDRSYALVKRLGEAALSRTGGTALDLVVEVSQATYGGGGGLAYSYYVDIAGSVRNTGAQTRAMDALMVAMVDRLDMPLVTLAIEDKRTIAPGETVSFTHRVPLNAPPIYSGEWGSTPNWQFRVGAMGR